MENVERLNMKASSTSKPSLCILGHMIRNAVISLVSKAAKQPPVSLVGALTDLEQNSRRLDRLNRLGSLG